MALPLAGAALILLSAWSESRDPSDAPGASVVARVRGTVTKPVVDAVGGRIQRHLRSRARARRMMSGLSLDEAIARFLDPRHPLSERRVYAYRLAAEGSPRAIAALLTVLETAPAEDRAFIVQLIGSSGNRAVKRHLWPLVDDPDERVARAALRGLIALGGRDVAARLATLLRETQRSTAGRVEAAIGLGQLGTPSARKTLVAALAAEREPEVAMQIVESLGRYRFAEIAAPIDDIVTADAAASELQVAAVEALANSSADAAPYLLEVASDHHDPEVRASAAWATGALDGDSSAGPRLAELAEGEPEADVRRRLYEALLPQREIPAERLLPMIGAEHDIAARVAGFNAVGAAVGRAPATALAAVFDREIVPELQRIATTQNSLDIRMRAVFALRRARTPATRDALAAVVASAPPTVATAARHGLETRN